MRRGLLLHLGVLLAASGSSSCFAVSNLDRFRQAEAVDTNFSSLHMTVRGFVNHVHELFEYRIVDNTNVIQSRGIIVPLGGPDATFQAAASVPKQNGPFHVDFYADHDGSGGYDNPRPDVILDHSWRLPLTDSLLDATGTTYVLVFDHNTSFTELNTPAPAREFGLPAKVHLTNLESFQNRRIEVRISDASTKRQTAMHRAVGVSQPAYDAVVSGMVESGLSYTVEVYTDDASSSYAAPSATHTYRQEVSATDTGLEATFDGKNPGPEVTDASPIPVLPAPPPP
jgi:hypothetical protein